MKRIGKTIGPISVIIQLGAIVAVATLLPLGAGLALDARLHTTPWATLIAMIIGVIAAVAGVYGVISRQYKNLG